jgi:desampylase
VAAEPDSSLAIAPAAAAAIRAAAVAARPQEACGLLFGHPGRIVEATVAANIATDRTRRFEIDPAALFAAHRRGREGPLALIGVWHSHPGGTPVPSAIDAAGITDQGWIWLIESKGNLRAWLPDAASPSGFRPLSLAEDGRAAM